ncbi:MAG: hypothetical protein HOJ34_02925 [Kordiimonadaceae bacterium]|jgi:hypothetical protein|nr:hypothetical protein [Kordiimonadaceae bacterium]MBT6036294.1 hypothetical protein [Kordiimonadaceae bacterium]MBT6328713.1 hypothetical protein [Kordiimonadaceae bacterium]MBT7583729.1 hypothetical protein [Kordiimonadaceae bacterium]
MIKNILIYMTFTVLTSLLHSISYAQEIRDDPILYQPVSDSPILERNPALSGEGEAFDFLIGDWDVVITWHPEDGSIDTYRAKWHNHWVVDGRVVMQEWRGPTLTGSEFRFYDIKSKSWSGRNIYAEGAWRETKAKSEGDTMVVTIFGKNQARGDFLNRETYFNITKNTFEMKSDVSLDDAKTWKRGDYSMTVTRTIEK